jgi:radical SAM-linked protein
MRLGFSRGAELRFITHLDLMRFWERALRRAEIDVAYSEGFSPHPQISLAAPLPVGVTSRGELMDVFLASQTSTEALEETLSRQLPPGLSIISVTEIPLALPSIQSQLRAAEYEVAVQDDVDMGLLRSAVADLLAKTELPWIQKREKETKRYDLRPLILGLWLRDWSGEHLLEMRLRADNEATGRPDQVIAALNLPEGLLVERTRLLLSAEWEMSE